jgi:superfamily I DNA and RNA helicase
MYGVAGSGKTFLLIARAKWLHDRNPHAKILLLCYNVVLSV